MYCVVIVLFESLSQDALGLILQTSASILMTECLRTKTSISTWHWESCLAFQGKYFDHF